MQAESSTVENERRASEARPGPAPGVILAVVGFSVFVAADDLTVVSTMLRPIIGDLGLTLPDGLDDAAWIVNAYLIAFIAIMPIAGRLSDLIGRRHTFVGAYLLFMVGTILIPLSVELDDAFGWFLVGRMLTAIGGGAMVPVALAVVGDVYPVGRRARALGTLGAIETMGWVWGPLYGAMLVRFLSWQWQFWLNVPFAIGGLVASWWALEGQDRAEERRRLDWGGALLLTIALVSLNLALLGGAEIQSVSGLEELTGERMSLWWLYPVAAAAGIAFVLQQRSSREPLFAAELFAGRNLRVALLINFVVGAGLVIAMVDVPLFINSVEIDLERAAVRSGWVLSALTAAMALFSYVGGRATQRWWHRPPILVGVAMSTFAFTWMGATWDADASYGVFVVQLALLGAGFGLTVAPTTSVVVDAAPPDLRGAAAAIVMVVRLLGLSVGLSALTAWGLARFESLRRGLELPPLTDPDFDDALLDAQAQLTAQSIAETFTAAAVVLTAGVLASTALRRVPATPDHDHRLIRGADVPTTEEPDRTNAPAESEPVSPADDSAGGGGLLEPADRLREVTRRLHVLIGGLGVVVIVILVLLLVTMDRARDAERDARAARTELSAALVDVQRLGTDLERVEAGAALYASQIAGFQELFTELGPEVSQGLDEAIAGLRRFSDSTINFDVSVDEVIPVDTEVVIARTVSVPISTMIPINESFDTTIEVDTPLGGLPLDVTVPVDIEVPVEVVVEIPIDEVVPIQDEFPIRLDVPIVIEVGETELAELTDSLALGLESLREVLGGLDG